MKSKSERLKRWSRRLTKTVEDNAYIYIYGGGGGGGRWKKERNNWLCSAGTYSGFSWGFISIKLPVVFLKEMFAHRRWPLFPPQTKFINSSYCPDIFAGTHFYFWVLNGERHCIILRSITPNKMFHHCLESGPFLSTRSWEMNGKVTKERAQKEM